MQEAIRSGAKKRRESPDTYRPIPFASRYNRLFRSPFGLLPIGIGRQKTMPRQTARAAKKVVKVSESNRPAGIFTPSPSNGQKTPSCPDTALPTRRTNHERIECATRKQSRRRESPRIFSKEIRERMIGPLRRLHITVFAQTCRNCVPSQKQIDRSHRCKRLIFKRRGSGIRTHDPLLPKQVR